MDDEPNQELRQKLAQKPPGEPLSISEIRELKKIENERVNRCIERGLTKEDETQVWTQLFAAGKCLPANRRLPARSYVTGITALNIPWPDRLQADWHSLGLFNGHAWCWSGEMLKSTEHLLGNQGLRDATEILRRYVPDTPEGTFAAGHERAVFDLLHHFTKIGKPVPNIQYKDIDHALDADQIKRWIQAVDLPEEQKKTMLAWFDCSE